MKLTLILTALLGATTLNADQKGKPKMAVIPFENLTSFKNYTVFERNTSARPDDPKNQFKIDRYAEMSRSLLENILSGWEEIDLIDRSLVDGLLLERTKSGEYSGRINPAQISERAKRVGADFIAYGQVLDFADSTSTFNGYGIKTATRSFEAFVTIRILSVEEERVVYTHEWSGVVAVFKSKYGEYTESDFRASALRQAFTELSQDQDFQQQLMRRVIEGTGKKFSPTHAVLVDFAPKPSGCDVTLDGHYVGTTPVRVSLEGGKEYKVSISKEGFETWNSVIVPSQSLKINKELSLDAKAALERRK